MSRNRKSGSEAPGEDAFLDVVANLVGILIILVMVIGAQAQQTWQKAAKKERPEVAQATSPASLPKPDPEPAIDHQKLVQELEQQRATVERSASQVSSMQTENAQLERRIKEEQLATKMLDAERDAIQVSVLQMESAIKALELEQSAKDQQRLKFLNQQVNLQEQFQDLQSKIQMASTQQKNVKEIEHRPTPISKTVFGDEIHLRLSGGRVAYVPMMELVSQVKSEIEIKGKHLQKDQTVRATVGPIEDFRMQYVLRASEITVRQDDMAFRRRIASVEGFVMLPIRQDLGENMQQALSNGSRMLEHVLRSEPETTTISIWVYPDSFAEYRQLKEFLTERGFMIATWPLPADQPISGSPNGMKSSAQ